MSAFPVSGHSTVTKISNMTGGFRLRFQSVGATLCLKTHNMAQIPMNQRNSSSFMIAQSADLWEPWQHSPNENTNCLFRQYFSKGTDFLRYSPAHRAALQDSGVRNPAERFNAGVASTG